MNSDETIQYKKINSMNNNTELISFTLNELLNREIKASNRGDYPVSIILVSVVHFSGKDSPDEQKKACEIASLLRTVFKSRFRETDLVLSYDGDKILLILPFLKKSNISVVESKINGIFDNNTIIAKASKDFIISVTSVTCPDDGKILKILQEKLETK